MGTDEKLVPGELLKPVRKLREKLIFNINKQTKVAGLKNNTNEEITHV